MDLQKDMVVMLLSMLEGRFALTNHHERNHRNTGLGIEIPLSQVSQRLAVSRCCRRAVLQHFLQNDRPPKTSLSEGTLPLRALQVTFCYSTL